MSIDKKKLYMLSSALAPAFLLVCFVTNAVTRRFGLAIVVGAALTVVLLLIKKQTALSINKKQVLWVLPTFGFLGIVLLYMLGLVFGFYKVNINFETFLYWVLPFALIITGSELIRSRLLMQNNRIVSILSVIAFIVCDVAMLYETLPFASFKIFVDFMGDIVFPCVASGLLYHYVSKRYGALPVIIYRLLMTLYNVLIPIYPAVPAALLSFLKIAFPIITVLFVAMLYERKRKSFSRKKARVQIIVSTLVVILMAAYMMLISCQFRLGIFVIASESMTGSINKGDAIIYEAYHEQMIEKGQVLVFVKDNIVYIHRVVEIEKIDGQIRYYTKGDANDSNDVGFITRENIVGLTDLTIKYIGYPTLWVREIFSNKHSIQEG